MQQKWGANAGSKRQKYHNRLLQSKSYTPLIHIHGIWRLLVLVYRTTTESIQFPKSASDDFLQPLIFFIASAAPISLLNYELDHGIEEIIHYCTKMCIICCFSSAHLPYFSFASLLLNPYPRTASKSLMTLFHFQYSVPTIIYLETSSSSKTSIPCRSLV